MAVAENATIAQTYDDKLRAYADEISKFRHKDNEITKLLNEEDRRIQREALRDCDAEIPFVPKRHPLRTKDRKGIKRTAIKRT